MDRTLLIVASALLLGMPVSLAAAYAPASVPCADDPTPDACGSPLDSRCGPPYPCCYVDPATGKTFCCVQVGDRIVCFEVTTVNCTIDPASGQVTCCYIDPATGQLVCFVLLSWNEGVAPANGLLA